MTSTQPTRNLALELVRVTEAAALAAGRHMGRGNKVAADHAAVEAMRMILNTIEMEGVIVIGEGEKDEAPMLFNGERLGTGQPPNVDIAVDPIDGTRPLAMGLPNSIATVALAPRGTMFDPGPYVYMDKIAVGPEAKDVVDIEAPVEDNLKKIAQAKGADMNDLTIFILDRPRHDALIAEVRRLGIDDRLGSLRYRCLDGHRRHPGRRAGCRGLALHGRHHSGQAVCPQPARNGTWAQEGLQF
jgi:fructose-1,6-bisphosphatase II